MQQDIPEEDLILLNACEKLVLNGTSFMAEDDLNNLRSKYPQNPDVLALCARSSIEDVKIAEKAINECPVESLAQQLVLMEIHLLNKDEKEAYNVFKNIKAKWSDFLVVTCYEIIFYCYVYNTKKVKQYLDKAKNLLQTLSSPATSFEESCVLYAQALCEWVVSANQSFGSLNVAPYWKKFTERVFSYSQEYLDEQRKLAELREIEERRKKEAQEKAAAEERKRLAEENARKEAEEQERLRIAREAEEKKQREIARIKAEEEAKLAKEQEEQDAVKYLNQIGISIGSFKDDRDGNEYKTVTIDKQTWMAEPLRCLYNEGECSLVKGVRQNESGTLFYTWCAMMMRTTNKIVPDLGSRLLIFGITVICYVGLGLLLHQFCDFSSIWDYVLYWVCGVFGGFFAAGIVDSFAKAADKVLSWNDVLLFPAVIGGFIFTDYFWIIWMLTCLLCAIVNGMITTSVLGLFFAKTIAPKGWKIPSSKDVKLLKESIERYDVTKIEDAIRLITKNEFLTREFWLKDLKYDCNSYKVFFRERMKADRSRMIKGCDINKISSRKYNENATVDKLKNPIICIKK